MAFDDLTLYQAETLIHLIEAINSGDYQDQFYWSRQVGQHEGTIHLYGKSGISDKDIPAFTNTDLETLKQGGYIVSSGGLTPSHQKMRYPEPYKAFHLYWFSVPRCSGFLLYLQA